MRRDPEETAAAMGLAQGPIGAKLVVGLKPRFWPKVNGRVVATPDMPLGGFETAEEARLSASAHQQQAANYLDSMAA